MRKRSEAELVPDSRIVQFDECNMDKPDLPMRPLASDSDVPVLEHFSAPPRVAPTLTMYVDQPWGASCMSATN
jgi:hypothetical protein